MKTGSIVSTFVSLALLGLSAGAQVPAVTTQPSVMLDMTFTEFEAALNRTDIMLIPMGAIEEHGPHLPLSSDAIHSLGQMSEVASRLRAAGFDAIVGPPLNIGITYSSNNSVRPGANIYPGNLTVRPETFVALYIDVLRSLRENGVRRVFLYSGHFAAAQIEAMARIAEEATRTLDGLSAYALIDSGQLPRLKVTPGKHLLIIDQGMNADVIGGLLGTGTERPTATHADGWEVSTMLHFRPDLVRPGFEKLPYSPSTAFIAALLSGDRTRNPNGTGGYPTDKASAAHGKTIVDYRTGRIAEAILKVLK